MPPLALVAFRSKAVVLLILIHYLLLLPLISGDFVFDACFVVQYIVSFLAGEEGAGWFIKSPFSVM